jgi:cell division protein FtsW
MTCLALGIVQSVAAKREEIKKQEDALTAMGEENDNPLEILSEAI